eukprot:2995315-Rhodomonas_salina.1
MTDASPRSASALPCADRRSSNLSEVVPSPRPRTRARRAPHYYGDLRGQRVPHLHVGEPGQRRGEPAHRHAAVFPARHGARQAVEAAEGWTQNVADALTTSRPAPSVVKHREYLCGSRAPFEAFDVSIGGRQVSKALMRWSALHCSRVAAAA